MASFARASFAVLAIFAVFVDFSRSECRLSSDEIEKRITELIGNMTLAEKLGQLQQSGGDQVGTFQPSMIEMVQNGSVGSTIYIRGANETNMLQRAALESRLKIPPLIWLRRHPWLSHPLSHTAGRDSQLGSGGCGTSCCHRGG